MTPTTDDAKILERINKSGFPLQMALEHHVKESRTGWRVGTREHHWKNARTGQEGWIDLVLEKRNAVLVVECKRAIGGKWAFLVEKSRKGQEAKCRVVQNRFITYPSSGNTRTTTTVDEILLEPYGYQSEYCIGAGENHAEGRELLERIAATALSATEAIARHFEDSVNANCPVRHYCTAIVTTAELFAAFIDSSIIRLADGMVSTASTERVQYIRFTKQLWAGEDYPTLRYDTRSFSNDGKARVHTVHVINAEHFVDFLQRFAPDNQHWDEW